MSRSFAVSYKAVGSETGCESQVMGLLFQQPTANDLTHNSLPRYQQLTLKQL